MLKFWSEIPTARAREMVADVATWAWVALWVVIGARIHDTLAAFAEAGRVLQSGGQNIQGAGATLGGALHDLPLVGSGIDELATGAFGTAGEPFIYVGRELESLLILVARLLALLVIGVMVIPWLSRYLPWRAERLARVRAAHRAIRRSSSGMSEAAMERALASRALNRLSYPELLEHTSDPFGDFATGRYERLAKAELASVGLR
ncbi:MAG TPA: hypothetical protein VFI69_06795 [Candidatus Limnocylindrales bacterium]|nr:hypothetical protein [Candidatus Limnocylindrales bacterium]